MSNSLAASKKLMQNYLSELLTDEQNDKLEKSAPTTTLLTKEKTLKTQQLDELLQNIDKKPEPISSVKSNNKIVIDDTVKQEIKNISGEKKKVSDVNVDIHASLSAVKKYRQGSFQAMFFDVAGLIIAVPLIELGGIHNVDKTTSLMGKPEWFKGVMVHREDKINVVDTALWVMPEKCNPKLKESLNYQYVIMLNDSSWGLMAEHLIDTVTLEQEDVKWLDSPGKRPWLAGLVKNKMCALLNVDSLIKLLDNGADINQNE